MGVQRTKTKNTGIYTYETRSGTRYRAVAEGGTDPVTGEKRPQQTRGGLLTIKEAREARAEMIMEAKKAAIKGRDWTVNQLAERWLAELALAGEVEDSTYGSYDQALNRYWLPVIGKRTLGDLTTINLQDIVRTWQEARAKPYTIQSRFQPMRAMCRRAVAWGLIERNPAAGVKLPRVTESPGRAYSIDQVKALISVDAPEVNGRVLIELLVMTGMRIGEALALHWEDVDFESGIISVRRTLSKDRQRRVTIREGAKTRSGVRQVLLLPETVESLRIHQAEVEERKNRDPFWVDNDLVFPSYHGARFGTRQPQEWMRKRTALAKIPTYRLHDLRHTHTTILKHLGIGDDIVNARIGHKGRGIIARYTHLDVTAQEAAVKALRGVFYERTYPALTRTAKPPRVINRKTPVRSQKRRLSRGS